MFRTYQKNDFAYFVSLIFLVFPVLGVFGGYYPVCFDRTVYHRLSPYGVFEKGLSQVDSLSVVLHSSLHYLYVSDLPGWHDVVYLFQR